MYRTTSWLLQVLVLVGLDITCPEVWSLGPILSTSLSAQSVVSVRQDASGFRRAYIVTEHGPLGPWEIGKTRWKAAIEPTSSEKGKLYARGFEFTAIKNRSQCLGPFAFLWGHKQETTATWFGMLLPSGERLSAADLMSQVWGQKLSLASCPEIRTLKLERVDGLKPGERVQGELVLDDKVSSFTIRWKIVADSLYFGTGGDRDTSRRELKDMKLTKEWKKYHIDLSNSD